MENINHFKKNEEPKHPFYLAIEIMEKQEVLVFPGINPESYAVLKAEEESLENYSDFATPIDEIIEDCKKYGMRILPGLGQEYIKFSPGARLPDMSNASLLPANSNNLGDSLRFKHLNIDAIEDPDFKKLVQMLTK